MLVQTIRDIRAEANAVNGMSSIMSDVSEHNSIAREDSAIISRPEIKNENDHVPPPLPLRAEPSPNPSAKGWWKKLMECGKYPDKWLEESRGLLMVVATMITAMTFQALVNPPGGVWQDNSTHSSIPFRDGSYPLCSKESVCVAGTPVFGYVFTDDFFLFRKYNTISFVASVSVILLLVSGFPLHNRISMWLLSTAMCVTLTFLALTYLQIMEMMVPLGELYNSPTKIYKMCIYIWIGLPVMVGVMNTFRFLIWVVKKLRPAYFSALQRITSSRSFPRNV